MTVSVYQCLIYIIGIATGEIKFIPDLTEHCRKIDRLIEERAAKKNPQLRFVQLQMRQKI